MIVGNGMMANAMRFIDRDDTVFFCSGVSNSSELNESAFLREYNLLIEYAHLNKKLIYFSSYFVNFENYRQKSYYNHKFKIEQLIQSSFKNYAIYRLPQVVGFSGNPNTLTNFIYNKIISSETIPIFKNAKRNLIDVECIRKVVDHINKYNLFNNEIINLISTHNYNIEDIIRAFDIITDGTISIKYLETSENEFPILIDNRIYEIFTKLEIIFDDYYLEKLIQIYYEKKHVG